MRKLEVTTFYGDGWHDEWGPYLLEGHPVNTYGWSDKDFTKYVRAENARFKKAGDNTRLRSVEVDDEDDRLE